MICTSCYNQGEPKSAIKGSFGVEILLYVATFWLAFLPAIAYSLWRHTTSRKVCSKCGLETLIPLDTPKAKEILKSLEKNKK